MTGRVINISEPASRLLVGLEFAVFCLPITALFLYGGLPSFYYFLVNFPSINHAVDALASIFIAATLICAWRILFSFILGGRDKLRGISKWWWPLPYATACMSLIAPLFVAITETPSAIGMLGWGLPFLLPLAHLHFESKNFWNRE